MNELRRFVERCLANADGFHGWFVVDIAGFLVTSQFYQAAWADGFISSLTY
jgi:hypothetical protein